MSQAEQYFYLYYMQKYHNTLMQKIKESKIIIDYNSDYSEDFVKRRYRAKLINRLISNHYVKNMKETYDAYVQSKTNI